MYILVWECVPEFNTRTMSCIFTVATEAATPVNGPVVGDRRPWLWGTNCGDAKCRRLSPLYQAWQPCMVRGDHPWLPHLVRAGGPIMRGDHW